MEKVGQLCGQASRMLLLMKDISIDNLRCIIDHIDLADEIKEEAARILLKKSKDIDDLEYVIDNVEGISKKEAGKLFTRDSEEILSLIQDILLGEYE